MAPCAQRSSPPKAAASASLPGIVRMGNFYAHTVSASFSWAMFETSIEQPAPKWHLSEAVASCKRKVLDLSLMVRVRACIQCSGGGGGTEEGGGGGGGGGGEARRQQGGV